MELASGHTVHLQPECSAPAVVLRLPQALKQALAAAQQNGERVAFRCSQVGTRYQATLSVGILQHHFTGVPVEKQTVLRLSTLDDVHGAVVANIGCKLHQQKALHTSDIGSRIRASAQAEKQGRGQTQVLDRVPPSNGHSKVYRSLTPPAAVQRPAAVQPRPKTPPPNLERSSAAAPAAMGSGRSQAQAARLAGRALTPPNSRPTTPPPARQQQQQAAAPQQQQQPRPQSKPLSKDPPKPRSLSGNKQQQRKTPPPAGVQQQMQRSATAPAGSKGGRLNTPPPAAVPLEQAGPVSQATTSTTTAAAAVPRVSSAPSAVPAAPAGSASVGGPAQGKAAVARPVSKGGSTLPGADKAALQRSVAGGSSSRPGSRGVSPAVGNAAAAAKQQQSRSAMPLISVQPLPQAPKPAGDRRSPAPSVISQQQQQQQQQPQRSRLQQGSNGSRPASAVTAGAGTGSKQQPSAAAALARPASAPSNLQQQQQQQTKKRPAPSNGGAGSSGIVSKAAKMRCLNDTGAAGGTTSQPAIRKAAAQQQQQQPPTARQPSGQPLRRGASPSLPAVVGQRLSPDGSFSSAGASPSQQQQHTKHWFTSSDESGEVCSVGDEPVGAGRAAAAVAATGMKRNRESDSNAGSMQPSAAAAGPAATNLSASTAQQSWAAAIQAKKQQPTSKPTVVEPPAAGRPRSAVDPATAKISWQAALKRQSPPHQAMPTKVPAYQQHHHSAPKPAAAVAHKPAAAPVTAERPAAKAAQPLDLGPPGYRAFADRGPRSFSPIGSQQEYEQYAALYEAQYPMYLTLNNIIETNIRYVREAHAKMAAEALGSPAHIEAKQQLQQQLTSKAELTRRWNAALANLHAELSALKSRMQQWIACTRAEAAATVAGTTAAQLQLSAGEAWNALQQVEQQQCLGGKGLMLAAAHGVPHAAVVGA